MSLPLIAVTAAAGKTGRALVRELRARDLPVRALVRRRDARGDALAQTGAEVVETDLDDPGRLAAALSGVRRAYYCPPISPDAAKSLDAFVHAAAVNRLEAVTAMSQWLASPNHPTRMTRDMWAVEQRLPALRGAAVTILNPGFFADNYLRVGLAMAAQLGLYPNLVGDSRNAPPSTDDMARVAAAVLADPGRHAGRRYRVTGPALIGVREITAALSAALGRRVRAIAAPDWLLAKVAAYRGEPRYAMAVFRHYLVDHRQGAFAFGAPTDVVRVVTGRPAESFEATARTYAAEPEARRGGAAVRRALAEFALAPFWRGYDHEADEHTLGPRPPAPRSTPCRTRPGRPITPGRTGAPAPRDRWCRRVPRCCGLTRDLRLALVPTRPRAERIARMTALTETVRDHYQAAIADRAALLARIGAAVDAMGPPLDSRRFAPLDQFHMGGLAATAALAERVGITAGTRVLDAGAGLGGPARHLAETFGCRVEGVDLSPDYVAVARLLTDRAGLAARVAFEEGDLARLPFEDARFDLVWTQHVAMNIADRAGLYRELRRVLKRGGRLAFYDPVAADGHPDLLFPVPWAQTADASTLLTAAETRAVLGGAGFAVASLENVTDQAFGWAAHQGAPAPGGVNAAMVVGARMAGMAGNFVTNLREGRVRLAMGVAEAA